MQEHYQRRYLCNDWKELTERLTRALNITDIETIECIKTRTFIPAGNTLLAGIADITPNCSILGLLTDDNFEEMLALSIKLWKQRTGIGYDLSGLTDPVDKLKQLSLANDAVDLGHRPKRGNMAVLSSTHPRILEFISCKDTGTTIYNFNISVSVDGKIDDKLLQQIAERAWATGDPGLVFLDNARRYGPVVANNLAPISTCVPCGEQFMHAFETCNLGSINLNSDMLFNGQEIDLNRLRSVVRAAINIMDSVVDLLVFPDDYIKRVSIGARRIGLGVMGWADYLKRINIHYDSTDALKIASYLSAAISSFAEERSRELAIEKGPCAHNEMYRNLSLTCIAPTGGITGLTENKGYGIEPYFNEALLYDYKVHINMQAAWQHGIHNAVSKTINLPNDASVSTVFEAYKYAMGMKVKGITVYRDGCKDYQPIKLCPECI